MEGGISVNLGQEIYGIPVILNLHQGEYVQRRKHRKKRIDKKWRNRYGFKFIPSKEVIIIENPPGDKKMIMHPIVWEAIRLEMDISKLKEDNLNA